MTYYYNLILSVLKIESALISIIASIINLNIYNRVEFNYNLNIFNLHLAPQYN